ncbi:cytochrome P450 [Nocardioides fonticola]|uniref:Cytochrome P450 n=1 Tax=Nocardioides fonticola TaxID=450363 RepID=A0ABP7XK99_9ACTN
MDTVVEPAAAAPATPATPEASGRAERPYDPADLSSLAFWSSTAAERERTFAELRAARPISWHPPVEGRLIDDPNDQGFWAVVRHADLVEVTRRHDDFLSGEGIVFDSVPKELLDAAQGFIAMDPPDHTKIRRLLVSAFTPKQMARIEDRIEANARRIVDDIAAKGEVDFVREVAMLVPMHNIFDMMDVPEHHRLTLAETSELIATYRDLPGGDPDETIAVLFESLTRFQVIAGEIIAERRAHPGDDLVSALVQAEIDGERLTDADISSFFALLMVAGNDTTRQSTAHGMKALTDFPEQRAWLMEDLAGRLAPAVEEIVRWATPIMTFRRTAARDCELGGQRITAGDKVIMFYASANWDTDVFEHPERLDLGRTPNKHISFGGGGIHHCLGNQLARRQLAATFRELLTRLPDIAVSGETVYGHGTFFHTVSSMPVTFTPEGR